MLGLSVVVRCEPNKRAALRVGLRTVDVGAHRKGRVVGEGFCSVVIGTVDVRVVLKRGKYRRRGVHADTHAGQDTVQPVQRRFWHGHAALESGGELGAGRTQRPSRQG